jgi:peptide/nickel transport system permease protein
VNILQYILRRALYAIPILLGVLFLLFVIFFNVANPYDMAMKAKGEKAPKEVLEAWIQLHGYDKPKFPTWQDPTNSMLFDHFRRMLTFDFGNSDVDDQPILKKIRKGMGPSLMLATPSFFLSVFLAVSLSLFIAFFRGSAMDQVGVFLCVLGMSIVILIYILMGQFLLSKTLKYFPISGYERGDGGRFIVLPLLIGLVAGLGSSVRFYRTIMVEETGKDYVRTARAKGVSDSGIMFHHVLKNAMIPILTQVVMAIPYLFLGSLLMESFFGIPGLGSMTKDAIDANDFATLRVMVFIGSVLFIVGQTATDISYCLVDPRVRLE